MGLISKKYWFWIFTSILFSKNLIKSGCFLQNSIMEDQVRYSGSFFLTSWFIDKGVRLLEKKVR